MDIMYIYCYQIIKRDRKSYIINISKEYSIVSQFTSFVAIEKREKASNELLYNYYYYRLLLLG